MYRGRSIFFSALLILFAAAVRDAAPWAPSPGVKRFAEALVFPPSPDSRFAESGFVTADDGDRRVRTFVVRVHQGTEPLLAGMTDHQILQMRGNHYLFEEGALRRPKMTEATPDEVRQAIRGQWASRHDPGQRAVAYMIDRRLSAVLIFFLNPALTATWLATPQADPVFDFGSGVALPLGTYEQGEAAATAMQLFLFGSTTPAWRAPGAPKGPVERFALRVLERVGLPLLVAGCGLLGLLSAFFWVRFGMWTAAVLRPHWKRLVHPGLFLCWFVVVPGRIQRRTIRGLAMRHRVTAAQELRERAQQARASRLGIRSRTRSDPSLQVPLTEPPPTDEGLRQLAASIECRTHLPTVAGELGARVRRDIGTAFEQRNPWRTLRMLEHARDLLECSTDAADGDS